MQSNLSGELKSVFTETLDPRLVSLLQEQLAPINLRLVDNGCRSMQQQEVILSRITSQETYFGRLQAALAENEVNQSAAIDKIQQHITSGIEELRTKVQSSVETNIISRRRISAKRRQTPVDQPLQMLQAASDDELLDRASLEEM